VALLLNLGAGWQDTLQGYDNIDLREISGCTRMDVRDLDLRYKPESVDEIRAIDIYEHIPFGESQGMLTMWVSLLKVGGRLIIQSPSIEAICRRVLTSTNIKDIEDSIKYIYGNQDYPENFHHTAVHPELMIHYLRNAGVKGSITFKTQATNLTITAIK